MPTFNTPLLQQAYDMYALTIKKEKQRKRFEEVFRDASSLQDLIKYTEKTKESDKKKRSTRVLNKLDKLLGFIRQNSGVLETLSQINGLVGCSIWGPLKLVVKLLSDSRAAIEKISRMMERLVQNAEFCKKYQELHGGDDLVQSSLKSFYYDVVHFCAVAVRNFEQSNWKKVLKPLYRSASADFDMVIEDLEFHGKKVSEAATVADMEQAKSFRNRVDDRYDKDKKEQIDKDRRKKEARTRCWLNPGSYYIDQHKQQQGSKTKGTNDWFIKHTRFEEWEKQDKRRLLWVHGKPGCGKSFLASTAIQYLRNKNTNPLYYFYNEKEAREDFHRGSIGFLGAFLLQLFETNSDEVRDIMIAAWEKAVDKDRVASFYTLRQVLLDCLPKVNGKIVCILDALDECTDHELLVKCIANVSKDSDKIKFCIMSRDEALIRKNFGPLCEKDGIGLEFPIEDDDIGGDIKTYVETKITGWAPDKRQMSGIESRLDELVSQAEGMFLWARLMMDVLDDTDSPKEIKTVLSDTPKALDGMYELIFSRIISNCKGNESKLRCSQKIFKWATCAKRSLTVAELRVALAIEKDDKDFQEENMIFESCFKDRIRIATGQLIDITPSGTIQLAHLTIKEFLFKECPEGAVYEDWVFKKDEVHADLAENTLSMLLFDRFNMDNVKERDRQGKDTEDCADIPYVFLPYCVNYWHVHCTKSGTSLGDKGKALHELAKDYVNSEKSYVWFGMIYGHTDSEVIYDIEFSLNKWGTSIIGSDDATFKDVFFKIGARQHESLVARGDHLAVDSMMSMAGIYMDQGKNEEALQIASQIYETLCNHPEAGPERKETIFVLGVIAQTLHNLNRDDEAEKLLIQSVEQLKRIKEDESPIYALILCRLSRLRRKKGFEQEANEYDEESMEVARKLIPKADGNMGARIALMGDWHSGSGRHQNAVELFEAALEILFKFFGIEHAVTQLTMKDLANEYFWQNAWDKREKLDKRVLEIWTEKYGEDHPKTIECMELAAETRAYRADNDDLEKEEQIQYYEEAIDLYETVIAKRKIINGEKDPRTLEAMKELGGFYADLAQDHYSSTKQGDAYLLRSEELLLFVLEQTQEQSGYEARDTLGVMYYLMCTYRAGDSWDCVESMSEFMLTIYARDYGLESKETIGCRKDLVEALRKQEKHEKAEKIMRLYSPKIKVKYRLEETSGMNACWRAEVL